MIRQCCPVLYSYVPCVTEPCSPVLNRYSFGKVTYTLGMYVIQLGSGCCPFGYTYVSVRWSIVNNMQTYPLQCKKREVFKNTGIRRSFIRITISLFLIVFSLNKYKCRCFCAADVIRAYIYSILWYTVAYTAAQLSPCYRKVWKELIMKDSTYIIPTEAHTHYCTIIQVKKRILTVEIGRQSCRILIMRKN